MILIVRSIVSRIERACGGVPVLSFPFEAYARRNWI